MRRLNGAPPGYRLIGLAPLRPARGKPDAPGVLRTAQEAS